MIRPKCKRCNRPLDFWHEPENGKVRWSCNNLANKDTPMMTDEEFARQWEQLPGDDVVRLKKLLESP